MSRAIPIQLDASARRAVAINIGPRFQSGPSLVSFRDDTWQTTDA